MNDCLVSIIMPLYNVSQYVEEAISSILNQSYKNIELIINDDCSSDDTYKIASSFANKDNRVILLRNDTNSKICTTLNKCVAIARGKYIVRMDGDDISEPNRIEEMVCFMENHKDYGLLGSNVISISNKGDVIGKSNLFRNDKYVRHFLKFGPTILHIWIARREVYTALNGYRNIPYAEDYDFLLRFSSLNYKMGNLPNYLYRVRIRDGNTATTNGLIQRKTKEYVYKLYKQEKKEKKQCFSEDALEKYVCSSTKEKKKYERANIFLQNAISIKKNLFKKIYFVFCAYFSSKYMRKYIHSSIHIKFMRKLVCVNDKNN